MFSCVPVKKGYYYSYSYYHLDNYCISLTPGLWNLICFVKFRCMAGSVMPHPADWFLLFHRHKEVLDTCSGSLLQLETFLIGAQLCPLVVKTSLYFTNWTELNWTQCLDINRGYGLLTSVITWKCCLLWSEFILPWSLITHQHSLMYYMLQHIWCGKKALSPTWTWSEVASSSEPYFIGHALL